MLSAAAILTATACVAVGGLSPSAVAAAQAGKTPAPTPPGAGSSNDQPPAIKSVMDRQARIDPAAQLINAEAMRESNSGFAGLAFEGSGLTLYWKGALSEGLAAAVTQARRTAPVHVTAAKYSAAELQAAGARIHQAVKAKGSSTIESIAYRPDGSGLDVAEMPASEVAAFARVKGHRPVASATQVLADAHPAVSVHMVAGTGGLRLAAATRTADSAPWNGGDAWAAIRNGVARSQCTTGFGVHNSGGSSWMLTAAHCATAPDVAYQGVVPSVSLQYMGPVQNEVYNRDLIIINTSSWHWIFDGPPNTTTTKNVTGWAYWSSGQLVCQSGYVSGTVCGISQDYSQDITVSCSTPDSDNDCGYTIYGLIRCHQVNGTTAARPGDSGGPVFTVNSTGVTAKGITSAGSGSEFYFQDWADVIANYGAYPNVNGTNS
jgi:hypothetical protein